MSVDSWMATWLATRTDLRSTSQNRVIGIIGNYILPKLGRIPLGTLQLAVDDRGLPANPAQRLKLPKKVKHQKRYLTHDQVAVLAIEVGNISEGSKHGYDIAVPTLANCGLRWGELSGLRVGGVDLVRRRLEARQTVVADKGYQRIEAPKDYEHRSILIPAFLATLLTRQTKGRPPTSQSSTAPAPAPGCAIKCSGSAGSIRPRRRSGWAA